MRRHLFAFAAAVSLLLSALAIVHWYARLDMYDLLIINARTGEGRIATPSEELWYKQKPLLAAAAFAALPVLWTGLTLNRARGAAIRWRRRIANLCAGCGYDLAGNTSGVCPECGMAIKSNVKVTT
ncbi:MAG TPA: hypothetical protein VIM11_10570 [Tepidisphaeraceae bacterium]